MTGPSNGSAPESIPLAPGCAQAPEARLNPNVRGLGPSSTLAINERSDRLRRQGRTIFAMGLGQSPFPVPDPGGQVDQQNNMTDAEMTDAELVQLVAKDAHNINGSKPMSIRRTGPTRLHLAATTSSSSGPGQPDW